MTARLAPTGVLVLPVTRTGVSRVEEARIDGRRSWRTAWLVLAMLSFSYGSPLPIVVAMKTMQEQLGLGRSVIALAGSLVWVGTG